MNLKDLYSQIITENSRNSAHRHEVEGATHTLEGVNPSCGDDIILSLRVEDGVVADGGFTTAKHLCDMFLRMITGEVTDEELEELEDAAALQGISKIPARVKCAVLSWHTLEELLD